MTEKTEPRGAVFSRSERIVAWIAGLLMLGGLIALILWQAVFVTVNPGQAGVRYSLLFGGTDTDVVLPEGFAVKLPWDRIYLYEVRVQQIPFELDALSREGMAVKLSGNLLYRPRYAQLGNLQKSVGPDYRSRLVGPVSISAIREATAAHNSHELYSIDYNHLKGEILDIIATHPSADLVDFVDILIRKIELPRNVTDAIEQKLTQEQLAASYEFRLLSQKQEAERQRIEAIGIRTFYSIVSEALTDTLLTWRGIEATVELSKSPNSKVVVVGGGADQMPLILGSDIVKQSALPLPVPPMRAGDATPLPDWDKLPSMFPETTFSIDSSGSRINATIHDGSPITPGAASGRDPRLKREAPGGGSPLPIIDQNAAPSGSQQPPSPAQ